jgi:predicted nicotinamide N-methyase
VRVGEGKTLTLHERPGEAVGGYTWPGGRLLASFILSKEGRKYVEPATQVHNGVVVELGCGVGVVGLALSAAFHECAVLLTDRSEECLDLARQNAVANAGVISGSVAVSRYSWGDADSATVQAMLTDSEVVCGKEKWPTRDCTVTLVLGADVLYTSESVDPLLASLSVLTSDGALVLLSYKQRGSGEARFFTKAVECGFSVNRLTAGGPEVDVVYALRRLSKNNEAVVHKATNEVVHSAPPLRAGQKWM